MEYNKEQITIIINNILLNPRLSFFITKMLLQCVFVSWNKPLPDKQIEEKDIRRFLIVDFYEILYIKKQVYIEELNDYSKTSEEHLLIQTKIKKINELELLLQKKEYHDEIIYFMNILV
jgi:hypothetical protein